MRKDPITVWTILAIILTLVASLALSAIPLGVGPGAMPWPNFTLCVVFFWIIHRPLGMPTLAVLFTGLAHDLVTGGVPGAGTLALLIGTLILKPGAEALDRSAFGPRWLAFAAFAAGVIAMEWGLSALPRWSSMPLGAIFAQFLVTVLAYVPVSVLFRRVLRIGRT